jgi:hypothetical protein
MLVSFVLMQKLINKVEYTNSNEQVYLESKFLDLIHIFPIS